MGLVWRQFAKVGHMRRLRHMIIATAVEAATLRAGSTSADAAVTSVTEAAAEPSSRLAWDGLRLLSVAVVSTRPRFRRDET